MKCIACGKEIPSDRMQAHWSESRVCGVRVERLREANERLMRAFNDNRRGTACRSQRS